jgi:hypothetical protein
MLLIGRTCRACLHATCPAAIARAGPPQLPYCFHTRACIHKGTSLCGQQPSKLSRPLLDASTVACTTGACSPAPTHCSPIPPLVKQSHPSHTLLQCQLGPLSGMGILMVQIQTSMGTSTLLQLCSHPCPWWLAPLQPHGPSTPWTWHLHQGPMQGYLLGAASCMR